MLYMFHINGWRDGDYNIFEINFAILIYLSVWDQDDIIYEVLPNHIPMILNHMIFHT